jgi:diguanylate cyclase (GGDEF)-like protein
VVKAVYNKRILVLAVSALLLAGFLATSVASYWVSRQSLRSAISETELPLTSDNIYSEIQNDLIRPVLISSVMASDTFVRNWILQGERDPTQITQYLREIKQRYNAFTTFFVSDRSLVYYHADGVLKKVSKDEPRDVWYFRVRDMKSDYEINVDPDMANSDALTIFINYRVRDYDGNFIGATGVGLTVNAVRTKIDDYEERFKRTVYFVDQSGKLVMVGQGGDVPEADITARGDLASVMPLVSKTETKSFQYNYKGEARLLNVRYIDELHWYLFVEKSDEAALQGITRTLYWNLLISLGITLLVLFGSRQVINRFQGRLEEMATTDQLTGLATRHAYELLMQQALREAHRHSHPLSVLMVDIDRFKLINDGFGHIAGDRVLRGVADAMRAALRSSDIVCRWGGDEFMVVLHNCDIMNGARIAETIRTVVEQAEFKTSGGTMMSASVSVGVASLAPGEVLDHLLTRADDALYQAKEEGRNCVRVAETPPDA